MTGLLNGVAEYYPDPPRGARTNRWELLAQHSRRTWELMKKTDAHHRLQFHSV